MRCPTIIDWHTRCDFGLPLAPQRILKNKFEELGRDDDITDALEMAPDVGFRGSCPLVYSEFDFRPGSVACGNFQKAATSAQSTNLATTKQKGFKLYFISLGFGYGYGLYVTSAAL